VIDPRALLDDALEVLVVPSFTDLGYAVRRRLWGWEPPSAWSMAGRVVVLTGPTSGLGREAAGALAAMGARLVLVGRDAGKMERVATELAGAAPTTELATVVADLSSLASVREAADRILATEPRIDVLIDNAGAMFAERAETPEGVERTVATMVHGPFVLAARLLPRLLASPDARLIAVTSGGQYTQALRLDDLDFRDGGYDGPRAYARAKRAQVTLIREWSRRFARRGLCATAMHPGWADTPGLEAALPGFRQVVGQRLRTAAEGIDTLLWLAAGPAAEVRAHPGRLFLDRRVRPFDRVPSTRVGAEDRRALWDLVVARTGEPDPSALEPRAPA
jgi:NAD(P)-dependent dehydrogenase (short-subunit alcohol dehydrogenase family)